MGFNDSARPKWLVQRGKAESHEAGHCFSIKALLPRSLARSISTAVHGDEGGGRGRSLPRLFCSNSWVSRSAVVVARPDAASPNSRKSARGKDSTTKCHMFTFTPVVVDLATEKIRCRVPHVHFANKYRVTYLPPPRYEWRK